MVDTNLVHLVEDVAQVGLAIHAHLFHRRQGAADDALLAAGRRIGQAGAGVDVQAVQVRQQFLVDELEQFAVARREQRLPLPAEGLALGSFGMIGLVRVRRSPVLPAEGAV